MKGYHDGGMLTTAKHFPGRGDVERIPHLPDWTWNAKPSDAVRAQDFETAVAEFRILYGCPPRDYEQ